MVDLQSPERMYEKRKKHYEKLNLKQVKTANIISNLRLLVFVAGIGAALFFYFVRLPFISTAVIIAAGVAFTYIVWNHIKVLDNKKYPDSLAKINDEFLKRVRGEWRSFDDAGEEYIDIDHVYSYDLDIFGKGSLFQMINITKTHTGREKLRAALTNPLKGIQEIKNRQAAVSELSRKLSWRQRYTAEGMVMQDKQTDPHILYDWAEQINGFYLQNWVKYLFRSIPVFTLLLLAASLIFGKIPVYIPGVALAIQFVMLKVNSYARGEILEAVRKYKDSIRVYDRLLKMIEKKPFTSEHLNKLKNRLTNSDGKTASEQIHKLSKIVDSISNRYNIFYIIFDIVTLWDYQCLISLEGWKEKSGRFLREWIDTIGEIEALSSLALLAFDNEEWVMPEIVEEPLICLAKDLGHPLLGKKCVRNHLKLDSKTKILLVTGSNMSGKSTFLRTAGINLILAYIGAPVCAKAFSCSMMEVYTCMRVSDNLDKSISSFYAELLRIKTIVKASGEGRNIFFLLDEIFKGTNSTDRHTGARVLVKKLARRNTVGLVSTHDLELGDLEEENPTIKNRHFREYYQNDQIMFDYKLQTGISKTRNAIYLMKLAGIDFEDKE